MDVFNDDDSLTCLVSLTQKHQVHLHTAIPIKTKWVAIRADFMAQMQTQAVDNVVDLRKKYVAYVKSLLSRCSRGALVSKPCDRTIIHMAQERAEHLKAEGKEAAAPNPVPVPEQAVDSPSSRKRAHRPEEEEEDPEDEQHKRSRPDTSKTKGLDVFSDDIVMRHLLLLVRKHEAFKRTRGHSLTAKWHLITKELFELEAIQQLSCKVLKAGYLWQKYTRYECTVLSRCCQKGYLPNDLEKMVLEMANERKAAAMGQQQDSDSEDEEEEGAEAVGSKCVGGGAEELPYDYTAAVETQKDDNATSAANSPSDAVPDALLSNDDHQHEQPSCPPSAPVVVSDDQEEDDDVAMHQQQAPPEDSLQSPKHAEERMLDRKSIPLMQPDRKPPVKVRRGHLAQVSSLLLLPSTLWHFNLCFRHECWASTQSCACWRSRTSASRSSWRSSERRQTSCVCCWTWSACAEAMRRIDGCLVL